MLADRKPIMSSRSQVLVTFRTDDTVTGSGFQVAYEQERESDGRTMNRDEYVINVMFD